jgi:hypothetical protein
MSSLSAAAGFGARSGTRRSALRGSRCALCSGEQASSDKPSSATAAVNHRIDNLRITQ